MYSRIVNCTIVPARVSEFKSALNKEFLPRIQVQPGFIGPTVQTLPVENSSAHHVRAGRAAA
jgi:hypothetical protein